MPHQELLEFQLGWHLLERFERLDVPRVANRPESQFFGHRFSLAIPAIPVTDSDQSRWLGSTDPPHPIDELVACGALDQGVGDPIDISETRGFVE